MDYKNNIQSRVRAEVSHLNNLYFDDKIVYPRVDNNYFGENYNFFAHPDLKVVNNYCEPLSKESYYINRNTILLYLGHKGFINASTINSVNKFISTFFNERLNPFNAKHTGEIVDKFLNFCENKKISSKTYTKQTLSNYPSKYIYTIKLKPTATTSNSANERELKKITKDYRVMKKSINSQAFTDDDKCIVNANDFFEELEKFKLKRKLLKLKDKYAC